MLIPIIIISIIILIFAFLLNMKIKAEISYLNNKFNFCVKYICFTIYPFKKKNKKIKKRTSDTEQIDSEKKSSEINTVIENESECTEENNNKNSKKEKKIREPLSDKIDKLFEMLEKVKIIWKISQKHFANILKHIYIEELMVDFIITNEDAYKAAVNYGAINAAVFNIINFIRTFFTVTIKTVDILCDFDAKDSVYDFSVKVTVKPLTILSAVFGILFGLLINIKKLIGNKNKKRLSDNKAVSM